jgi:UTP:GlnB (protein PII) uridylyltransferase
MVVCNRERRTACGVPYPGAKNALERLQALGIVRALRPTARCCTSRTGRCQNYAVARHAALFALAWADALESAGFAYPRVMAMFVHGSAFRRELRRESDVDLLVLGDVPAAARDDPRVRIRHHGP